MATYSTQQYFLDDYPRTLFPMATTSILVERFGGVLQDFVYQKAEGAGAIAAFAIQQRCYAAKRGYHLRRTIKLDPPSEFFIYDIVLRNRKTFRSDHRSNRQSFGYRFSFGQPESARGAYAKFKSAVATARSKSTLTLKTDVATYFNSIYHHDLVQTLRRIGWLDDDVSHLSRFLRELNAGRSVDCLPQGLHPCKVLGSEFLRFIDDSFRLKSAIGLRFLDDIHLFDDDEMTLVSDLIVLQELLGEKGLSLNDSKTSIGLVEEIDLPRQIDRMKRELLQIRREVLEVSGCAVQVEYPETLPLSEAQTRYLLDLLSNPDIEESDAELVLTLLRDHADEVLPRMLNVLSRYPGLTRNLYHYVRLLKDRSAVGGVIASFFRGPSHATEHQLFWLIKLTEDFLGSSKELGEILTAAYDHQGGTIITRAKVLEIGDTRFGLPERRNEVLRSGRSDWEAWAAAMGARCEARAGRNHLLGYFGNASPINRLIAQCVQALP